MLASSKFELPYARVDILDWKTSPKVSELELIEPELFFRVGPDGVFRFGDAIELS